MLSLSNAFTSVKRQTNLFGRVRLESGHFQCPRSLLIAPFTSNQQAVILGVNIGGLGTLLASLANLIGYNLFRTYYPNETKKFLGLFSVVNFGLLLFLGTIFYFFIH